MTVLVVDDNAESRYLLVRLLEGNGYTVKVGQNGAEAMEILKTGEINLIISDILMPVMDGFLFCRSVRKTAAFKTIPFIMYTATYTGPHDEDLAKKIGADRFIIKPCEPDILLDTVQTVLAESQRRKIDTDAESIGEPSGEDEIMKLYNERLVRKLEMKMVEAEHEIEVRKRTEKALEESEARLMAAQRIGKMGNFTWDVATGEVTFSESLMEMLKNTKDYSFHYSDINTRFHHPEDIDGITKWIETCFLSDSNELSPYEYRLVCRDGEIKYARTLGIIEREGHEPVRVFAIVMDITEHKQVELNLRALKKTLEQEVEMKTRELKERIELLEEFHDATIEREFRIKELRDEIERIKNEKR